MTIEEITFAVDDLINHYNASAVAIDGQALSGKTTLAAYLSKRYGAPVIHTDDYRLPLSLRPRGWEKVHGGEMDFDRFREEVTDPWLEKKPIIVTRCDEKTGEMTERLALPDAGLYIVEGTYATHPEIADIFDLRLFGKVSEEARLARERATGKTPSPDLIARENACFSAYMTEELADGVFDETLVIPQDETEKKS